MLANPLRASDPFISKHKLVLMVLLFLTHLQSLEFALYLETPTTTLLMDGHLTFREHVSTF